MLPDETESINEFDEKKAAIKYPLAREATEQEFKERREKTGKKISPKNMRILLRKNVKEIYGRAITLVALPTRRVLEF